MRLNGQPRTSDGGALRRGWVAALVALVTAAIVAQPACAGSDAAIVQDPFAALRSGQYEQAIGGLRSAIEARPADIAARRALVEALYETARYDEAIEVARAAPAESRAAMAFQLGQALEARGRWDDAEAAYTQSMGSNAADAALARVNLGVLQLHRGQREQALETFDSFIDLYNGNTSLSTEQLVAVGTAVKLLGLTNPQLFKDAVKAYDEAITAGNARSASNTLPSVAFLPRLLMGELFLDKYNSTEAQELFKEVLAVNPNHPRALLDMAAAKYFDGSTEPLDLVKQSLEVAPDYVDAHVFLARLLADLEDFEAAKEEVDAALAVNPSSLDAIAVLAGIQYVTGDQAGYETTRNRALAINPANADFHNTVAEMAVRQRRYGAAVELAREAVRLDPRSWWGWGIIGLNSMRGGNLAEAREALDTAFAGDPYNVWIKNTLDLLDTFDDYRTVTTDRFAFMLHGREADLLSAYIGDLAEEAYTKLAARYEYSPPTPIRIEVYPSHADFSVRTVGLGGLGALGVSFGTQLAMDSPSAREQGQFNWGSTLWHEVTHTFTLGVSGNRVPRWFTEGLSVLEERRARPGWGDDVNVAFLSALKRGDLHGIGDLNQGFLRPRYPAEVGVSYFQASLVAELIEAEYGFDAILDLLRAYRDGATDEEAFRRVLRTDFAAFDSKFNAYVQQRFGKQAGAIPRGEGPADPEERGPRFGQAGANFTDSPFAEAMIEGRELMQEDNLEGALAEFERAKAMFPEYANEDSPYAFLAEIREKMNRPAEAAAELDRMTAINENAFAANMKLAELREKLNQPAEAAAALQRVVYIWPFDLDLHRRLADLYATTGDKQGVVRERLAVVALNPVDRAEAFYRLALAYFDAGDRNNARRQVLRALEIAPNFQDAQELLLRVSGG